MSGDNKKDNSLTLGPTNLGLISKNSQFTNVIGTIEELQSNIGLIFDLGDNKTPKNILMNIIEALSDINKNIYSNSNKYENYIDVMNDMENTVKFMKTKIKTINNMPLGSQLLSQINVARSITRRAERELVAYDEKLKKYDSAIDFLNRLSNYLLILCNFLI